MNGRYSWPNTIWKSRNLLGLRWLLTVLFRHNFVLVEKLPPLLLLRWRQSGFSWMERDVPRSLSFYLHRRRLSRQHAMSRQLFFRPLSSFIYWFLFIFQIFYLVIGLYAVHTSWFGGKNFLCCCCCGEDNRVLLAWRMMFSVFCLFSLTVPLKCHVETVFFLA